MKQIKEYVACAHKQHFVKMCFFFFLQQSNQNISKQIFKNNIIKSGINVLVSDRTTIC